MNIYKKLVRFIIKLIYPFSPEPSNLNEQPIPIRSSSKSRISKRGW